MRTLGMLLHHLPADGRFLDFGAGTGRYAEPLLQLTDASGVAYDICPTAGQILAERLGGFVKDGRLMIRDDSPASLSEEFRSAFDLVFLAFGVLAHVSGRANRQNMLSILRQTLRPNGVLIVGLPNRARRFRAERRAARRRVMDGELEEGDVLYQRGRNASTIPMFYHLFTPEEARREFDAAGLHVEHIEAESVLGRGEGRLLAVRQLVGQYGVPFSACCLRLRLSRRRPLTDDRGIVTVVPVTNSLLRAAVIFVLVAISVLCGHPDGLPTTSTRSSSADVLWWV